MEREPEPTIDRLHDELGKLHHDGPDFEGMDYPDAVADHQTDVEALENEIARRECEAAGTHRMVYQGRRHFDGDPDHSSRDVHACESCGHHTAGIYAF